MAPTKKKWRKDSAAKPRKQSRQTKGGKKAAASPVNNKEKAMIEEGAIAPDFRVLGDDGKEVSAVGFRGPPRRGALFLSQGQHPGLHHEAQEFRDAQDTISTSSASSILGCSADSVEAQAKFKAKYKLNFTLL